MTPERLAYANSRLETLRRTLGVLLQVPGNQRTRIMFKAINSQRQSIKRWEAEILEHEKGKQQGE